MELTIIRVTSGGRRAPVGCLFEWFGAGRAPVGGLYGITLHIWLYYWDSTMFYSKTDDSSITTKLTTCLAYQRSPKKKKKHGVAATVLQKTNDLVAKLSLN